MPALSARRSVALAMVAAFLLIQLAVPVVSLFGPRPARFAWHMYSALPPVPEAWALGADGGEAPVDLGALFAVQRAELDYASILRGGLCEATGAETVKVLLPGDAEAEVIDCR